MAEHERCIECDSPTGRAGRGEDSLYIGDFGPYCEECFEAMPEVFAVEAANHKAIVARLRALNAELVEALEAADRAFTLHVFSPRGHDGPEDRDTCRICGGNYRDVHAHITAQEGHPSDVKAEAIKRVRAAIANAKEGTS